MMKLLKAIAVSFSMYSRIPMPQFEWKEENMRYMVCFFPWVGAVIGGLVFVWSFVCEKFGIGNLAYTCVGACIPILVTGGLHVDGFMDTCDAFHSYQPKERKLEILKDAHIGAFSVIMLAAYGLLYLAAFSEIRDRKSLAILCIGFILSRCLSGLGVISLASAKKEGMLYSFQDSADRKVVFVTLILQLLLCIAAMIYLSPITGVVTVVAAALTFLYYKKRSYKELSGITGDTAGYFVLLCELAIAIAANF